ncbi:MAG: hypothetical protein ACI9VM_000383 [Candidatus Azotimanducaceae bacterium]|jgi:hypothetical protein
MEIHRHHTLHGAHPKTMGFWLIYPISIIFSFHVLLVAYIHSSYMEAYISPEGVGALFSIGSAIAVIAFLFFSHALRAVGNVKLTLALAVLDVLALVVLGASETAATAIVAFVVFLTVNPLLYLCIDIFSETIIGNDESATGSKRGLTLTLMSLAAVAAPLTMTFVVGDGDDLSAVYFTSAGFFVFFILFILAKFKNFNDPAYIKMHVKSTLRSLWARSDIRNVLLAHFTLQTFFTWAGIYIPLYLSTVIGLAWSEIGYIIAVGLTAYVLFDWPIGIIADKWIGEKELMAFGFVILAVSSAYIAFMSDATLLGWMVLVFITRLGASLTEVTTESYFFKHTKGGDAHAISFFRLLRPLSTVFGALVGSAALLYLDFNLIFVVLGILMVPGIFFTMALKDTK